MTRRLQTSLITRRGLLAAGAVLGAAPVLSARADAFGDSPKVSKDCVHFAELSADPQRSCGKCRLFRGPHACLIVAGEVTEHCGCRVWLPKAA